MERAARMRRNKLSDFVDVCAATMLIRHEASTMEEAIFDVRSAPVATTCCSTSAHCGH